MKSNNSFPPPPSWPPEPLDDSEFEASRLAAYLQVWEAVTEYLRSPRRLNAVRRMALLKEQVEELAIELMTARRLLAALQSLCRIPEDARSFGVEPKELFSAWFTLFRRFRQLFRRQWSAQRLSDYPVVYTDDERFKPARESWLEVLRPVLPAAGRSYSRGMDPGWQRAMSRLVEDLLACKDEWRVLIFAPNEHDDELREFEAEPDERLLQALLTSGEEHKLLEQEKSEQEEEVAAIKARLGSAMKDWSSLGQRMEKSAVRACRPMKEKREEERGRKPNPFASILLYMRENEFGATFAGVPPERVQQDMIGAYRTDFVLPLPYLWEFWYVVLHGIVRVAGGFDENERLRSWVRPLLEGLLHDPDRLLRWRGPAASQSAKSMLARRVAPWLKPDPELPPVTIGDDVLGLEVLRSYASRVADLAVKNLRLHTFDYENRDEREALAPEQNEALDALALDFLFPHAHWILLSMGTRWFEQAGIELPEAEPAEPAPPSPEVVVEEALAPEEKNAEPVSGEADQETVVAPGAPQPAEAPHTPPGKARRKKKPPRRHHKKAHRHPSTPEVEREAPEPPHMAAPRPKPPRPKEPRDVEAARTRFLRRVLGPRPAEEFDVGFLSEIRPLVWSYVRDPMHAGQPSVRVGIADPDRVAQFEACLRSQGVDPIIPVESIVRTLRYFEGMPAETRRMLPSESAHGHRWVKLKRAGLRILIRVVSDETALFHVYPRKTWVGPYEVISRKRPRPNLGQSPGRG